jgi:hypothetical protein
MVIINFEISKDGHTYRDAIHLPEDHNLSEEQIEVIKQQRFDNWYQIITNPPVEEEQLVEVTE